MITYRPDFKGNKAREAKRITQGNAKIATSDVISEFYNYYLNISQLYRLVGLGV